MRATPDSPALRALKKAGVTGYFGVITTRALKAFQAEALRTGADILITGRFDPATQRYIGEMMQ